MYNMKCFLNCLRLPSNWQQFRTCNYYANRCEESMCDVSYCHRRRVQMLGGRNMFSLFAFQNVHFLDCSLAGTCMPLSASFLLHDGFFFYCFELKMSTSNSVCHCWYICVCTVDSSVMIITLIHLLLNAAVEKSVGCSATYPESPGFRSRLGYWSLRLYSCVFVCPRRQMSGQYVISGHIRYLHILPFDTLQGDSRLNVLT